MPELDPRVEQSTIKLLRNVPLDATYTDTRWFESHGEQTGFFNGFAKHTFTLNTYQRVNNGIAMPRRALTTRVPIPADDAYDCNYLMFQNGGFSERWWYAFIKQVNYINPNNCEIVYEIDYLQTFMTEYTVNECFVEREHASAAENDKPFDNLMPEPITISDYMIDEKWTDNIDSPAVKYILVYFIKADWITAIISALTPGDAGVINGVYSGVPYLALPATETGGKEVDSIISTLAASEELLNKGYTINQIIVGIFMSPKLPEISQQPEMQTGKNTINVNVTALNSHTIRNKKLLTYPFQVIKVTSHSGGERNYKPELCEGEQFTYEIAGSYQQKTQRLLIPTNYGGTDENFDECIPYETSVQCLWSPDMFGASIVETGIRAIGMLTKLSLAGVAGGAAGGLLAGETAASADIAAAATETGIVPSAGNAALSTMRRKNTFGAVNWDSMQQGIQSSYSFFSPSGKLNQVGDVARSIFSENKHAYVHEEGHQAGDYLGFGLGRFGFDIYRYAPTAEIMEQIDEFFDMFGYAVNRFKKPNLKTRAKFNYVKLASPNITGSVPVGGMGIIKEAFSRGIRLWHVNEIGEYGGSNPPV